MATFVELNDAETDSKAFMRQALGKKIKDNFTNLNARVGEIEKQARLFDHFIRRPDGESNLSWGLTPASGVVMVIEDWHIRGTLNSDLVAMNVVKPDQSVGRFAVQTGSGVRTLTSKHTLQYDQVTLPILFECRMKLSADIRFWLGIQIPGIVTPGDNPSVFLERVDASNWRFSSWDTSGNSGSSFTKITSGNWFKVKIEFTDNPSARAICSLDDVVKETLTTQLPTNDVLAAKLIFNGAIAQGDLDLDLMDFGAVALDDAA